MLYLISTSEADEIFQTVMQQTGPHMSYMERISHNGRKYYLKKFREFSAFFHFEIKKHVTQQGVSHRCVFNSFWTITEVCSTDKLCYKRFFSYCYNFWNSIALFCFLSISKWVAAAFLLHENDSAASVWPNTVWKTGVVLHLLRSSSYESPHTFLPSREKK